MNSAFFAQVCLLFCLPWNSSEISLVLLPERNNFHSQAENSIQHYLVQEWCTVHAGFPGGPRFISKPRTPAFPKILNIVTISLKSSSTAWLSATAPWKQQHAGYSTQITEPHPCSDHCHLAQGESQEFATQPISVIYAFVKGYWLQPSLWEVLMPELSVEQHGSPGGPAPAQPLLRLPSLPWSCLPAPLRARLASCDLQRQARSCQEGLWRTPRDLFISNSLSPTAMRPDFCLILLGS